MGDAEIPNQQRSVAEIMAALESNAEHPDGPVEAVNGVFRTFTEAQKKQNFILTKNNF